MCMLCVEIQKGVMTAKEVARAFREVTDEHAEQVSAEIEKRGKQFNQDVIEAILSVPMKD